MVRRTLAALVAVGFVALAGCSGSDGEPDTSAVDALIDTAEPTTVVFDPNDPPELAGVSTDPAKIEAGECFNEYLFRDRSEFVQHVTTIVGCSGPHDREAYFRVDFPAGENASYPGDDELELWATDTCLDEFEDFVGLEYVLSKLEIGAIVPEFEAWNEGDRAVICYVYPDTQGRLLDSVANSGI